MMKVGDLVVSRACPDQSEIGIVVGINNNGDLRVQFDNGVYLLAPYWLEVI